MKNKIIIISPFGYGEKYNGPAISVKRLLSSYESFLKITVLSFKLNIMDCDRNVRRFSFGSANTFFGKFSYIYNCIKYIHDSDNEVILICTVNYLTLIPCFFARVTGKKTVVRFAAESEVISTNRFKRFFKSCFTKLSGNKFIAISSTINRRLIQNGYKNIVKISNGVDVKKFIPKTNPNKKNFSLITVGAIDKRKGQLHVAKALSMLSKKIDYYLLGPIKDEDYYQSILMQDINVKYMGYSEKIEDYYSLGDIFILPSQGEGMPNAMLEAMSCGLVPIGTNVSGIDELVSDQCGKFVELTPEKISYAINFYIKNTEKLEVEKKIARQVILKDHDASAQSKKLYDMLVNL